MPQCSLWCFKPLQQIKCDGIRAVSAMESCWCVHEQGLLPRESGNARSSLTGGSSDAASEPGQRGDLIRCYSGVACAIAPSALQGHPTALQLQRDTLHWLVNIVRYAPGHLTLQYGAWELEFPFFIFFMPACMFCCSTFKRGSSSCSMGGLQVWSRVTAAGGGGSAGQLLPRALRPSLF